MSGTNQEIEVSGAASGPTVQSVTGTNVDNTDPNNPIVNPLGLIQIVDLNGDFFTDLATATNWIEQFFSDPTIITDKSFNDNIFFFTVPNSTVMKLADCFLNNSTASFIDNFGLITEFQGGSVFYQNNAKHIFKDIFFNVVEAFTKAELNVECQDFNMDGGCAFASNTSGTFKIKGDIDPASASSGFFSASTATILASAKLYTSNAGGIDASLEQAILNGCNVQFDGINLVTLNTAQTLTNKTFDSPTITVGGITVSSTELSYLDGVTSPVQTQLNSKTKIVGFDTADALTPANTSNNVIKSITIPANTYTDGNVLRLFGGGDKIGTAGTITVKIYANTVNNLTGSPVLIAQSVMANTALTFQIDRNLCVRSTTTWGYASNVNNSMGFLATSTINSNDLAIDWTVTQYIIIAIQLANGADQVNVKVFSVVNF